MGLTIKQDPAAGDGTRVHLSLAGTATIGEVMEIKAALLRALADCGELLLDVSAITAADPALLQLIHSAHRSAVVAGKRFALVSGFSGAVRETARAAGFLPEDDGDNGSAQALWKE